MFVNNKYCCRSPHSGYSSIAMSRERVCSFVRLLDLSVPMLPGVNFDWDSSKSGAIKLYIILLLFPFFFRSVPRHTLTLALVTCSFPFCLVAGRPLSLPLCCHRRTSVASEMNDRERARDNLACCYVFIYTQSRETFVSMSEPVICTTANGQISAVNIVVI